MELTTFTIVSALYAAALLLVFSLLINTRDAEHGICWNRLPVWLGKRFPRIRRLTMFKYRLLLYSLYTIIILVPVTLFGIGLYMASSDGSLAEVSCLSYAPFVLMMPFLYLSWSSNNFRMSRGVAITLVLFIITTIAFGASMIYHANSNDNEYVYFALAGTMLPINLATTAYGILISWEHNVAEAKSYAEKLDVLEHSSGSFIDQTPKSDLALKVEPSTSELESPKTTAVVSDSPKPKKRSRFSRINDSMIWRGALPTAASALRLVVLYLCAYTVMAGYAALTYSLTSYMAGWVTLATMIIVDLSSILSRSVSLLTDPWRIIVLHAVVRVLLVVFGLRYWFLALSLVYLLVASYLGIVIVMKHLPLVDKHEKIRNALSKTSTENNQNVTLQPVVNGGDQESVSSDQSSKNSWFLSPKKIYKNRGSILTHPGIVLVFLTICFTITLVGVYRYGLNAQVHMIDRSHDQSLFGVAALILTGVLPLGFAAIRVARRNQWKMSKLSAVFSVLAGLVFCAGCLYLYSATSSLMVMVTGIFLPIITILIIRSYAIWVKHDYDYYFGAKSHATMTKSEKVLDVLTALGVLVAIAIAGTIIAVQVSPSFIGISTILVPYVLIATCVPLIRYFNTFEVNVWTWGQLTTALVLLAIENYLCWDMVLEKSTAPLAVIVLLICSAGYIILVLGCTTLYMLIDNQYKPNKTILILISVLCVVLLTGFIAITLLVDPFIIGAGLICLLILSIYGVYLMHIHSSHGNYLPPLHRKVAGTVVCIMFVVGMSLGAVQGYRYTGFSIAVLAVGLSMLAYCYVSMGVSILHTKHVFPVHVSYNAGRVESSNTGTAVSLLVLVLGMVWGLATVVVISRAAIGLFVIFGCFSMMFLWTMYLVYRCHFKTTRAITLLSVAQLKQIVKDIPESQMVVTAHDDDDNKTKDVESLDKVTQTMQVNTAALHAALQERQALELQRKSCSNVIDLMLIENQLPQLNIKISNIYNGIKVHGSRLIFTILSVAKLEQQQRDALMKQMLRELGIIDMTDQDIACWTKQERAAFEERKNKFLQEKKRLEEEQKRKAEEDALAAERRRREDDERRRKQAEEEQRLADEAARAERERIAKEAEDERKRAEAVAAETSRRIEAQRQAEAEEEKRRLAIQKKLEQEADAKRREALREQAEAEAKRAAEAKKKREDEEARRKEDERKRQAEAEVAARLKAAEEKRRAVEAEAKRKAEEERLKREEEARRATIGASSSPSAALQPHVTRVLSTLGSRQFTDSEFPPSSCSIGPANSKLQRSVTKWCRPSEIRGASKPVLFLDSVEPGDIIQGSLGDCWLLSSFSVLSMNPDSVTALFVDVSHAGQGLYVVQFNKNGKWEQVVIDDYLPTINGTRSFACSKNPNEMWVSLLEKAYAKMHRNYEAIEGGLVTDGLVDLTGGTGKEISTAKVNADALHDQLLDFQKQGFLLGCGSNPGSDTNVSGLGIVQGHAYAILNVVKVDEIRLIKLRNPWGQKEWTGDWSDNSTLWTKRMRSKCEYPESESKEDGVFWMNMADFVNNYRNVYVCRTFSNMHRAEAKGAWKKGVSAFGVISNPNGCKNPQYFLKVSRPTTIYLSLTQNDTRGERPEDDFAIGCSILDKKGKRAKLIYVGDQVASTGAYEYKRSVSLDVTLRPQSYPYTVFASTFDRDQENEFSLVIYSDYPVELTEIPANTPMD